MFDQVFPAVVPEVVVVVPDEVLSAVVSEEPRGYSRDVEISSTSVETIMRDAEAIFTPGNRLIELGPSASPQEVTSDNGVQRLQADVVEVVEESRDEARPTEFAPPLVAALAVTAVESRDDSLSSVILELSRVVGVFVNVGLNHVAVAASKDGHVETEHHLETVCCGRVVCGLDLTCLPAVIADVEGERVDALGSGALYLGSPLRWRVRVGIANDEVSNNSLLIAT